MDPLTRALLLTSGAAGAVNSGSQLYVEDVFSTRLYTGNGSTQTITNGIDLSGKGGLVWVKSRSTAFNSNLVDSARGTSSVLQTDTSSAAATTSSAVSGLLSNGFTVSTGVGVNNSGSTYASWTFRKAAKFFDIVTYVGDGSGFMIIPHNLGCAPGMLLIKRTDASQDWFVWHRSAQGGYNLVLNKSEAGGITYQDTASADESNIYLIDPLEVNGGTYVAYLFAHDAGGFGDSGNDNVISCGSYTGTGTTLNIDCGFTNGARFVLIKRTDSTGDWYVWDTARGIIAANDPYLLLNSTAAEVTNTDYIDPLSSGFQISSTAPAAINANNGSFIYLAVA